ncbi:hypothetical protein [Salinisphaera sp. Q1T1-3]|uniref:hypothetical protein n=1 Tax=Salinisphaera sp. Q1T1-3 TaxID=2321229 RepID=UPI000E71B094|nr:hypothetical protein [Salinisphaera sp. Q1T1-3]RJS91793.1 hypothetical protein D3260_14470 [Salinisphaera sp. Q1T1-3]
MCVVALGAISITGCGPAGSTSAKPDDRALKSCLPPDFDPAEDTTFVTLDSPLYPAAEKKADDLASRDFSQASGNAPKMLKSTVVQIVESSFFLLPMNSQFLPMMTIVCNHDIYAQNQCEGMSMIFGNKATLEDVDMDAGKLSYVIRNLKTNEVAHVIIGDRDYNDVSLTIKDGQKTTKYEFSRDIDGTEYFESENSDGETRRFVERPDCSGTFIQHDTENGGPERALEFEWTSAKKPLMRIEWKACRYTDGKKCGSGEF